MPQENYYIAHWGIKGQKWGIRRFRNYDDTLTEAGKRRYGDGGAKTIKKAEKERHRRAQILADPTKLYKHRNEFTKSEIETAMARFDVNTKLKEQARQERADRRANFERAVLGGTKEERLEKKLAKEKFKTQMVKEEAEQDKAKAGVAKEEYIDKQQKQTLKSLKANEARKKAEEERKIEKEKKDEKAARFERTAKKLKNLWEASQSLKSITDELGLTEAESGKSVFGSLGATLGFGSKKASEVPESKKEKKEKKPKTEPAEESKPKTESEASAKTEEAKPSSDTSEPKTPSSDGPSSGTSKTAGEKSSEKKDKKTEKEAKKEAKARRDQLIGDAMGKSIGGDEGIMSPIMNGLEYLRSRFRSSKSKTSAEAKEDFIDAASEWAQSSYGPVSISEVEQIAREVWGKGE